MLGYRQEAPLDAQDAGAVAPQHLPTDLAGLSAELSRSLGALASGTVPDDRGRNNDCHGNDAYQGTNTATTATSQLQDERRRDCWRPRRVLLVIDAVNELEGSSARGLG